MADTHDDGRAWGWMDGDTFRPLPKGPMIMANMGPPPFDVTLPQGDVRHVIYEPEART